ncbi:hypothetical protein C8Q80DRAFT_199474 [Daedaleopsis nitida]|nr:hypothetical protein C8Q80DRAFT_199474 [Daedaleopsis nitida]
MDSILSESKAVEAKLGATLGAVLIGFAATCALYGVTSLQTWMYFTYKFADKLPLRSAIKLLWTLDTLHVVLLTTAIYHYAVVDFGNLRALVRPTWSLGGMAIVSLVSNVLVRALFGMRILKLSAGWRWVVPVILVNALSLFSFGSGTYFVIKGLSLPSIFDVHEFSWSLWGAIAASLTADGITTASQCMILRRMKTGLESPDSVIELLMKYSINTALLTSLCALTALITFTTLPGTLVYIALYFVYSKLYVNSLLATLNARAGTLKNTLDARSRSGGGPATEMAFKSREGDLTRPAQFTTIISLSMKNMSSPVTCGGMDEV